MLGQFIVSPFVLGGYLLCLAIIDIKKRAIPLISLLMGLLLGIGIYCSNRQLHIVDLLGGIGIGLLFFLVSKCTKEKMGYGDSGLILLLGIGLGYRQQILVVCLAFFLLAAFSVIMLTLKKINKQSALPFLPFLAVAYLVCAL